MEVFAGRTRETTMFCLQEQEKVLIPKRGKNGRYYPPNWLICDFCEKSFNRRIYLRRHKHKMHSDLVGYNEVACKFCSRYYAKPAMTEHIRGKHPEEAKGLFPKGKIRKIGRPEINQPTPFQCETCQKYFFKRNNLIYHMQIHLEEKPFKCNSCGCDFTRRVHFDRHLERYHTETGQEDEPNQIETSDMKLFNKQKSKSNLLPFQCWFCKKYFMKKQVLKIHMFTHMAEKPHNCESCGRGFTQRTHLARHLCTATS